MKVTIYGRENCKYCTLAKELVVARELELEYIDFVKQGMTKADLIELVGKEISTVPQIFVDGQYVGGYTDLASLLDQGKVAQ